MELDRRQALAGGGGDEQEGAARVGRSGDQQERQRDQDAEAGGRDREQSEPVQNVPSLRRAIPAAT
jgi:hypothetical protein